MIITLTGRVTSGFGEGRRFTQLPWVKRQIREELKFEPYPGTLNLHLPSNVQIFSLLDKFSGIRIQARGDFASGRIYKALIAGKVQGAIVRPEVPDYPKNLVEILAPISLREKLNLKDGDEVEIKIWLE